MTGKKPPDLASEEFWREFLTHGSPMERSVRGLFKRIPSDPRCEMCAAPLEHRSLELKGKAQLTEVVAVLVAPARG